MQNVAAADRSRLPVLASAEAERPKESVPRWQAGYDLAMGRAAAAKVRVDGYRIMLERAATGQGFKDAQDDHFEIIPAADVVDDPKLKELAEKSKVYLNRVIQEHPNTPWALMAQKELDEWLGWEWNEWFVDLTPPPRVVDRVGHGDGHGGNGGFGDGRGVDVVRDRPAGPPPPPPPPKRDPPRL